MTVLFCVSLSVYLCYTHSLFLSFTCTTARCMNSSHLALWNVKRILWCHWMYSQGGIDKLMTTQPLFAPQTSWTGRKVAVLFWVCLPAVSSVMCGVLGCGISSVFYACVVPHTQNHQHGKPSDTCLYMKWSPHKGRMKYWEELNLFMEIKKPRLIWIWIWERHQVHDASMHTFSFCPFCTELRACLVGIDLMDMASDVLQPEGDDIARTSWNLRRIISKYQETFSVIEKVWPWICLFGCVWIG